jgi:hypothetical protein
MIIFNPFKLTYEYISPLFLYYKLFLTETMSKITVKVIYRAFRPQADLTFILPSGFPAK